MHSVDPCGLGAGAAANVIADHCGGYRSVVIWPAHCNDLRRAGCACAPAIATEWVRQAGLDCVVSDNAAIRPVNEKGMAMKRTCVILTMVVAAALAGVWAAGGGETKVGEPVAAQLVLRAVRTVAGHSQQLVRHDAAGLALHALEQ